VEGYFAMCPWMNDFYGWKGWTFECCQKMLILWKNWTKKGSKQFMLLSVKTNPQMKCSSHNLKPYFMFPKHEVYSSSATFKPYKMLN
jgi:hypothetical protein